MKIKYLMGAAIASSPFVAIFLATCYFIGAGATFVIYFGMGLILSLVYLGFSIMEKNS